MAGTDPPRQSPTDEPSPVPGRRRGGPWIWAGSAAVVAAAVAVVVTVRAGGGGTTAAQPAATGLAVGPRQPSPSATRSADVIPPIRLKGDGTQASRPFTVTDGLAVFRSTCSGCSANFIVELLDPAGRTKEFLVNTLGAYDGSKGVGLSTGRYRLNITADAAWSVTITQPRDAKPAPLPRAYAGEGDQLRGPFDADHAVDLRADNRGQGNFVVAVLDAEGAVQDLAFNEIGTFSGSRVAQMLSDGPYYVNVTSDGTWKLRLSRP
ncbi:hypothetical protein ACGF5F_27890 [Streptomyces sp. NPDC047821]|uniref:hypothetical protein n=1 Tax=Streptomyces sp. NPDC047821 TaxID=3365488 RepID=UPI0037225C8E